MAKPLKERKPAHVWAWVWGAWGVAALALPAWVPILGVLAILGFYALVCRVLPTYDCPRCAGKDRSARLVVAALAALVGGHRAGCRSKRCHGGERIRLGVRLLQPARAEWLARNPGRPERISA